MNMLGVIERSPPPPPSHPSYDVAMLTPADLEDLWGLLSADFIYTWSLTSNKLSGDFEFWSPSLFIRRAEISPWQVMRIRMWWFQLQVSCNQRNSKGDESYFKRKSWSRPGKCQLTQTITLWLEFIRPCELDVETKFTRWTWGKYLFQLGSFRELSWSGQSFTLPDRKKIHQSATLLLLNQKGIQMNINFAGYKQLWAVGTTRNCLMGFKAHLER